MYLMKSQHVETCFPRVDFIGKGEVSIKWLWFEGLKAAYVTKNEGCQDAIMLAGVWRTELHVLTDCVAGRKNILGC